MGGLARRVSYIKAFRERFKEIPTLAVDSGYFVADERSTHGGLRADVRAKDDLVLKAYGDFGVDVANVSAHDLPFIAPLMNKAEFARNSATYSLLNRLVAANIIADSPDMIAPQKLIIREVTLRGAPAGQKPFRVAFIGLAEKLDPLPDGFRMIDPIEAARTVVAEARKQADYVIVLAHVKIQDAPRIAREVSGIDILISGGSHLETVFVTPVQVGKTFVVYTPYETRMIGELRLYRNTQNQFSARARFISIDEVITGDPAAEEAVKAAGAAEDRTRADGKQMLEEWLAQSRTRVKPAKSDQSQSPEYISSGACAECHMAQYVQWSASRHRYASDPLPPKVYEFEASCLTCHASSKGAGSLPRFQGVQCEACHGPGSEHAAKPAKGYGHVGDMTALCSKCHTAKTTPNFDVKAAWEKIKH